jgi:multidrug resistance efflux pump
MKQGILTSKRLWLPVLGIGVIVMLASWDYKQTPNNKYQQEHQPTDTTPKKKKAHDKKVRDLDDVLTELDNTNININADEIREQITSALKSIDAEKIKLEVEKAMKEVDFANIQKEIQNALKEVDFEKIKKEVQESIAKIDFDKIKVELDAIKKIDMEKMKIDMEKMKLELENIKPELEKEMANVKVEIEKAKVEIEKAKAEVKEYKEFVDGLDKDGLINKKDSYSIKHKDGELTINGKKASAQVYTKYQSFLEKHKKFNIEKTDDDFDLDMD